MRNCIGLHIWNSYGHCLGTLTPTTLNVSVANNQTIPCMGMWSGEVSIGGTNSRTHFAVFDCKGAFDVILGKPWLREVDAVHYYKTDTITINAGTTQTTIDNAEQNTNDSPNLAPTSVITPYDQPTDLNPTPEQSLDVLLEAEARRINTLHRSQSRFTESRWAKYLDIDEMEEEEPTTQEPDTRAEWFTTKAEQREIERARRRERKADRKQRNKEVLEWLTQEAEGNADQTRQETEPLTKAELRRQTDRRDSERWEKRRTMIAMIKSFRETDTDPIETAEARSLIESERRISKLRSKLDYLRQMAETHSIQDTTESIHMANTVTERDFTIE
jgi:hypothetical protein